MIPAGTGRFRYILARADADGTTEDVKERNNSKAARIRIGSPLPPDLLVSLLSAPSTASAGVTISVRDITRNQGRGAASPSVTKFFLANNGSLGAGNILLGSRNVPALAAGEATSGTTGLTIPPGTLRGNYFIIAVADGDGSLTEALEGNNTRSRRIAIE